ncbi:hypothetical protein AFCDBAGC_0681 [Methylobacterium cerastii]|uniref:Lipoprotein n=1 Tax=Methylobacterium cerastii TaxID=932741 RepID=A0ABQ4QC92_9HYPH|nr:hypothetical protein AFCDBAGC_0681 [Methylobacterium cerastii]
MRRALRFCAVLLGGCGSSENVETLYRNSPLDENARIHVATFDATESRAYNQQNCRQAQELFQAQPGARTRFWCEAGRYKQ